MPIYEPDHIEYSITSGHIQIVTDDGTYLPAYWAHPLLGKSFPGVALIHDWWGLNEIVRRIANWFAQMGHYVMAPDLFNGQIAATPNQAIKLVEDLQQNGYPLVDNALTALENHHHCNRSVAAVGLGMGGSLAFEAAIVRSDLEAAVAYGGFPDRFLGRFKDAQATICAFFGEQEPHVKPIAIEKLRSELAKSAHNLSHELHIVPDLGHEFFSPSLNPKQRQRSGQVLAQTMSFLDKHLVRPINPPREVY